MHTQKKYHFLMLMMILSLRTMGQDRPLGEQIGPAHEEDPARCLLPAELNPLKFYSENAPLRKATSVENLSQLAAVSACEDFYLHTCAERVGQDPSGQVSYFNSAEHRQLPYQEQAREFLAIKKNWEQLPVEGRGNLSSHLINEYLKRHQIPQKMDLLDSVLNQMKVLSLDFLKTLGISSRELSKAEKMLKQLRLNKDFQKNPDLLMENTILVDEQIHVGGIFLLGNTSLNSYALSFAHELGHLFEESSHPAIKKIIKCLKDKFGQLSFAQTQVSIEELWADWFAHQIFTQYLQQQNFNLKDQLASIKNAFRYLCGHEGSQYGHASGRFRLLFLASNPYLQKIICHGIEESKRPSNIGPSNYCF